MIANDETLVKRQCYECGDTIDAEHLDSTPRCPGGCRNPFLSCPACGGIFRPEQPPDAGQKVYLIHGCKRGQVQARLDNPTCLHCGAAKEGVGSLCGCPADTAKRKADADFLKAQQDAKRQRQELLDKERAARLKGN